MLTIEQFVKTALVEIARGIRSANEAVAEDGFQFAPPMHFKKLGGDPGNQDIDSIIRFDLAVTSVEGQDKKAGIGVAVANLLNFKGEVSASSKTEASAISRVQFEIKAYFNPPEEE